MVVKIIRIWSMAFATLFVSSLNAHSADFETWLQSFRAEAAAAGIDSATIDQAFAGVSLNTRVFELNDNQPEFTRAIWSYLDSAVSETRVANGRTNLSENRILLSLMEEAYGVDSEIIVAIWGLETAYGTVMGDYDAIEALATLGFEGRRTRFGRSQLIGALKILQNGYATRASLKGSWAGAMGHTQFIPTTYLAYAVDHDKDGKRDIWTNLGDVFASTANYLSASGYQQDKPWGVEVRLPDDFDFALADKKVKKSIVEWASLGVTGVDKEILPHFNPSEQSRLILPAGARGPAFLVFKNFDAILKYNNSTAYALAVGYLSEAVAGGKGAPTRSWPRSDRPLKRSERKALQQALVDRGFNPGPIDGILGAGTRKALRDWQKANGMPADGYASAETLTAIVGQ